MKVLKTFCLVLTAILTVCIVSSLDAQYRSANWMNNGYGNYNYSTYGKLWDDRVLQKQLELTKDQRRDLIDIKLDYDDAIGGLQLKVQKLQGKQYKYNTDGSYTWDKEVQNEIKELNKKISEINKEYGERGNKVLLPHQVKIRKQIGMAKALKSRGFIQQLSTGGLDRHLNVSPEQKKRIAEKKKQLDQKMKESIAEILDEIKEDLIRELDPEQRDLAREIIKDYEYRADKQTFSILQYEAYFMKKKQADDR